MACPSLAPVYLLYALFLFACAVGGFLLVEALLARLRRSKPVDHIETYRDALGQWRWRAVSANGQVVATGESHRDRADAVRAAKDALGILGSAIAADRWVEK